MGETLLTMAQAARIVALTPRTLYNAAADGRLRTVTENGLLCVRLPELLDAPLLQIGDAGERVERCWKTMRRWAESGRLRVHVSSGGRRFVSIADLRRAAAASS